MKNLQLKVFLEVAVIRLQEIGVINPAQEIVTATGLPHPKVGLK